MDGGGSSTSGDGTDSERQRREYAELGVDRDRLSGVRSGRHPFTEPEPPIGSDGFLVASSAREVDWSETAMPPRTPTGAGGGGGAERGGQNVLSMPMSIGKEELVRRG